MMLAKAVATLFAVGVIVFVGMVVQAWITEWERWRKRRRAQRWRAEMDRRRAAAAEVLARMAAPPTAAEPRLARNGTNRIATHLRARPRRRLS